MRIQVRKVVISALFTGIYGLSVLGFGQSGESSEKSLQGRWIVENVSVFGENGQKIPFNVDSFRLAGSEVPLELDIQQEDITFVWNDYTETVKCNRVFRGNYICIPFCVEWKLSEDKLLLQWEQCVDRHEEEEEGHEHHDNSIVLTYKLK